ncbi:MAG: hypothetical protein QOG97_1948, partial [Acidimicrobiaceae bacterium]|nr:hypothetical protein [Acidimicrobiaceae bacterium]
MTGIVVLPPWRIVDTLRVFQPEDPAAVARALEAQKYLPSPELASSVSTALTLHKPLLLEGEPGVGKTTLAAALAAATERSLIRLQCYQGISASQALYEWNFRRQLLALRAAEARGADAQVI